MSQFKALLIVVAAVSQLFLCFIVGAQERQLNGPRQGHDMQQQGPGFRPGGFHEFIQKELNLTDEQRKELSGLKETHQQNRQLQMKLMQQRQELNDALRSSTFSEGDIMDKVNQINKSSAELNTNRVQNIMKLNKALNPDQRAKLHDFMDKHRQERQERMGQSGEGGPGGGHGPDGWHGGQGQGPFQGRFRRFRE